LEIIRARMRFMPSWVGDIRIKHHPDAAVEAAYGDSRCIIPAQPLVYDPFDDLDGSGRDLAEYLAGQFEKNHFRRSTPEDLGDSILGQRDSVDERAVLWEELVDLTFAFEEADIVAISRFYRKWGSLGYPRGQKPDMVAIDMIEPWGWCLVALRWFQEVTTLFRFIEERRTSALWGRFGTPREIDVRAPEVGNAVFPRRSPFYDRRDYEFRYDTPDVVVKKGGKQVWVTPTSDADLYRIALALIQKAVSLELQKIPLVPMDSRDAEPIVWGFCPPGSFHAGLLQWFFEKLAGKELQTCAAEGCSKPVYPPQKKYCSPQCEWRTRQASYRARQAMAIRLHGEGDDLPAITRKIQAYFDMKKRPAESTVEGWIKEHSEGRSNGG